MWTPPRLALDRTVNRTVDLALDLARRAADPHAAPKRPGRGQRLELLGLEHPVSVHWDDAGVPHITAENRRDLFLAQGFVVARERAFQIDFIRRAIGGRLAELLGQKHIPWRSLTVHLKDRTIPEADLLMRTLGLRRAAEASVAKLSESSRALLAAYARGVTLAFESLKSAPPIEMRLLRYRPEPWVPADSISVVKGMAFELSLAWRAVLVLDSIAALLDDDKEKMRLLFPSWPDHAPPPCAWTPLRERGGQTVALEESWRAFTALGGAHAGSNAWVVSGAHTASGRPLLSGDPHLMMTAPSPHMGVHLCCPDLEVAGTCVPGVPGVVLGHNRRIAWSMTAACGHDADLFVEEVDLSARTVREGDSWAPLASRTEVIRVRGAEPLIKEVFETRHGPLINEVTHPLGRSRGPALAHALRWTGLDAAADLDGLFAIQTASSWTEFRSGLRHVSAPALNYVYADVDGHIGWQLAGAFPVRRDGSNGLVPTSGATDEAGWVRYLDLDELPHLFDPPSGTIVSANSKPVDDAYPWPLGSTWEPYHRYRRIEQLLRAQIRDTKSKLTAEHMARVQLDQRSVWAEVIVEELLRPALARWLLTDPIDAEARDLLLSWDFESRAESAGAAVFYVTYAQLVERMLRDVLGEDRYVAYQEMANLSVLPLERVIQDEDSPWLRREDREDRARAAFVEAVRVLSSRLGSSPRRWRWGALHELWHKHRLHAIKPLRHILSIGPFEVGGDGMTVNNAFFLHSFPFEMLLGPGLRLIMDVGAWDQSRFILSTGQSGRPGSPRYRDHAELWHRGEYHRLSFGPPPPTAGAPDRLVPPPSL